MIFGCFLQFWSNTKRVTTRGFGNTSTVLKCFCHTHGFFKRLKLLGALPILTLSQFVEVFHPVRSTPPFWCLWVISEFVEILSRWLIAFHLFKVPLLVLGRFLLVRLFFLVRKFAPHFSSFFCGLSHPFTTTEFLVSIHKTSRDFFPLLGQKDEIGTQSLLGGVGIFLFLFLLRLLSLSHTHNFLDNLFQFFFWNVGQNAIFVGELLNELVDDNSSHGWCSLKVVKVRIRL